MMKKRCIITLTALLALLGVRAADDDNLVITNDVFWRTTAGAPIYSQGGGIFRFPDANGVEHYYWYGVHYKGAETYYANHDGKKEDTGFVGVSCYQSDDLVNWRFVRNVLTPTSLGWAYWVGRMGVAYVEAAKKYAIVIQYNDNVLICTCNTPTGNFTKHNQIDMTNTIGTPNTGDQTVFTDPDTGKSYLVYSYGKGRSRIYLSEIGYKDGKVTLLDCHQVYKGSGREGNCMFKYKNKYYICASDLYGWNASNVYYLEASSIYGPYTPTNEMQKMPGADADYGHVTQTGFFYTVRGTEQETVVYCGDRWADFAGNGNGYNQWCPITFKNNRPYFNSLSQWGLDAETGRWWVGKDNNYVKNGSFDADRVNIPSANKPSQAYLRGWTTTTPKGNSVAIGSETSPVLNARNTSADRATVVGNFCLNITDTKDFQRRVFQRIASTTDVPLPDGYYTMTAQVKSGSAFDVLRMYVKCGSDTTDCNLGYDDSKWHKVTIDSIPVTGGAVEVGFLATGKADDWCQIDDVTLVRKGDLDAPAAVGAVPLGAGKPTAYYSAGGVPQQGLKDGLNIVRQQVGGQLTTRKVIHRSQH